jgi:hypothetical protein
MTWGHAFVERGDGMCRVCGRPADAPGQHYCCKHRADETPESMARRCECACHR